jgi:DNA polymerase III delta prime subunit
MRNKRNKKLIAHLFCILQKNQSYNSNLAQGIFFFKAKIARKYFLHALRSGCFTKHQVENIETKLEINQTKKFLSRLQSFNTDNKINEGNKEKLRKKLFLKSFKKLSK